MKNSALSENLRALRLSRSQTQQEVAELLGITRPAYSYYESGKITPRSDAYASWPRTLA